MHAVVIKFSLHAELLQSFHCYVARWKVLGSREMAFYLSVSDFLLKSKAFDSLLSLSKF